MGEVFCTDKPDNLADKPDSFEGKRGEEGQMRELLAF